jgi:hypothetical protein
LFFHTRGAAPPPPARDALPVFARPRTRNDELPEEPLRQLNVEAQLSADLDESRSGGLGELGANGHGAPGLQSPEPDSSERLRRLEEEGGTLLPEDARLLLSDLGGDSLRLYAIPTTTRHVSVRLIGKRVVGGSTIPAVLEVVWWVAWKRSPEGPQRFAVFGVVPADVVALEVELDGERTSAVVASGGFFYESDRDPDSLRALHVLLSSGASRRREI